MTINTELLDEVNVEVIDNNAEKNEIASSSWDFKPQPKEAYEYKSFSNYDYDYEMYKDIKSRMY